MKTVKKTQLSICLILLALMLSFIWGNSLLAAPQSAELSGEVVGWLRRFLNWLPISEHLVRKLAHFGEFACLGALFGWLFQILNQQSFHKFTMPLLAAFLAALVDETLQVLTPERGPSVIDVWIDSFGAAAGIALLYLGHCLWQRRKQTSNGGK